MRSIIQSVSASSSVCVLLLLFFAVGPACAQARRASLDELTKASSAVVLASAEQSESFWNDEHTRIYTRIKLRVSERVRGDASAEVDVIVPGGRVGNTIYEVSDMPVFDDGEEVLVFLWRSESGRTLVTGGLQGKLRVERDPVTGRKTVVGGGRLMGDSDPVSAGKRTERREAPRLEDVLERVKRIRQ